MKTTILCALLFCGTIQISVAAPENFAEFQQLSSPERNKLVAEANADVLNPARWKVLNWWLRLSMGEEFWHWQEETRLIDQNHLDALDNYFITYQHLRESCLRQEWYQQKVPNESMQEETKRGIRFGEIAKQDANIHHGIVPLLASLVPSEKLESLNDQARQYTDDWCKKYSDGKISRQEMTKLDEQEHLLVEALQKLPKMTEAQMQAAIEALPENQSIPRGLPIPSM